MRAGAVFLLAAALAGGASAPPAAAYDENARRYATTTRPYWSVGRHDRELSRLCQRGLFNQKRIAELYIAYTGKEGRGIMGIAKKNYNLHDPERRADPAKTYHFYADGTSECQVYVAP